MGRKCRKCDQRTGPNRRLCKDCALEKRFAGRPEPTTPLETQDGRTVGAWINVDGTWHASLAFDGFTHEFACGDVFDDFPADGASSDHHALEADAICPDCLEALNEESIPDNWARSILQEEPTIATDGGWISTDSTRWCPDCQRYRVSCIHLAGDR